MTSEEINRKIAEACGAHDRWVIIKRGLYYRPDAKGYTACLSDAWIVTEAVADEHTYPYDEPATKKRAPIPDYCSDLNAMADAEKTLTDEQFGIYATGLECLYLNITKGRSHLGAISATAMQRAEAFLKTVAPKL